MESDRSKTKGDDESETVSRQGRGAKLKSWV
jgi:hypothetical protein